MAIEDGCVLAFCLWASKGSLDALKTYEQMRVPRTRRTVLASRQRAKENHLASPWARLKRDVKIAVRNRFAKDKTVFQGEWLYAYDVGAEVGKSAAVS
jgi:salicylate hydroxylase